MKMSGLLRAFVALPLICGGSCFAANSVLQIVNHFNIVTGDYTTTAETEGPVFVYGSFNPQGSINFGFNAGAASDDTENVLWLNNGFDGSSTGVADLQSGSLVSRVTVPVGQVNLNGNGSGDPSLNVGQQAWDSAVNSLGLDSSINVYDSLVDASDYWASLPANTTATVGGSDLTFNSTPTDYEGNPVSIATLSLADLANQNLNLKVNFTGNETLIINVTGSGMINVSAKTDGFSGYEDRILFNFNGATGITFNTGFRGAVYAPEADLTQVGSNIDGIIVSKSLSQTAEVHEHHFNGYVPTVPEPSALLLGAVGSAMLLRRRRDLVKTV